MVVSFVCRVCIIITQVGGKLETEASFRGAGGVAPRPLKEKEKKKKERKKKKEKKREKKREL